MSTIVTRSGKGSILSTADMDNNLTNLNNDKIEVATIHNATEKTTPVNDDEFAIVDSAASYILKKFKWSSFVTAVTSALSTVYATFAQGAKADTALQPAAIDTTVLGYVAPGTSGNVLTSNGSTWTSAAPASTDSMTLLGTLTTTSGTTQTLSGLTLTNYKALYIVFNGVSPTSASSVTLRLGGPGAYIISEPSSGAENTYNGVLWMDLSTGFVTSIIRKTDVTLSAPNNIKYTGFTTSSTQLSFSVSAGDFDAGTIKVYGVK